MTPTPVLPSLTDEQIDNCLPLGMAQFSTLCGPLEIRAFARAIESLSRAPARPSDDQLWDQTLRERDNYHEWADKLADSISRFIGLDIGEHSSANNPWARAIDMIPRGTLTEALASRAPAEPIPAVLFDSFAVLQAMSKQAKARTGAENVGDVLDAVVYLLRAAPPAASGGISSLSADGDPAARVELPTRTLMERRGIASMASQQTSTSVANEGAGCVETLAGSRPTVSTQQCNAAASGDSTESAGPAAAEIEADARRYRWLRRVDSYAEWNRVGHFAADALDAAVDAAIKLGESHEG